MAMVDPAAKQKPELRYNTSKGVMCFVLLRCVTFHTFFFVTPDDMSEHVESHLVSDDYIRVLCCIFNVKLNEVGMREGYD